MADCNRRAPEEFKEITQNEAAQKYLESKLEEVEMKQEIEIVASRPRLDPNAWKAMRSELREITDADLAHIQGHFYDPFQGAGEISQIEEEIRMIRLHKIENQKVTKELLQGTLLPSTPGRTCKTQGNGEKVAQRSPGG